jgi:hypothetical protein
MYIYIHTIYIYTYYIYTYIHHRSYDIYIYHWHSCRAKLNHRGAACLIPPSRSANSSILEAGNCKFATDVINDGCALWHCLVQYHVYPALRRLSLTRLRRGIYVSESAHNQHQPTWLNTNLIIHLCHLVFDLHSCLIFYLSGLLPVKSSRQKMI